jgi:histidinol-phosphatase (PHP family)
MIRTDFHLHTKRSVDSKAELDAMVQGAVERGLTEIAITDHVDNNPADAGYGFYRPADAYRATQEAQRRYGDRITIRHGVEFGETHLYAEVERPVREVPLDIIIASIHYIGPDGVHSTLLDHLPVQEAIGKYFDLMEVMVRQGDMDVLGHLDYFNRYIVGRNLPPYNPEDYRDSIRNILDIIISRQIALEVNTSGYRSQDPRPFPHPIALKWYHDQGGRRISIGSDAHQPDHIGVGFAPTVKILREIGFREYLVFRNRQPVPIPL